MNEFPFSRIAIVGVGLIGGSWGLALRRAGFGGVRVGCDLPEVLRSALKLGAIDEAEEHLADAASRADLVVLAAPVGAILQTLPEIKSSAPAGALVTDVGSTKRAICERAAGALRGGQLFLGGHPFAGKERSGIQYAQADLFQDATYVLTPQRRDDMNDRRAVSLCRLISDFGARVVVMEAAAHDEAAAWFSHLPQLLSTALASLIEEQQDLPMAFAASGFRDATRLAESPYAMWRDICATNLANIQQALDALILKLKSLREKLSDERLEYEFEQAQKLRDRLNRGERI